MINEQTINSHFNPFEVLTWVAAGFVVASVVLMLLNLTYGFQCLVLSLIMLFGFWLKEDGYGCYCGK